MTGAPPIALMIESDGPGGAERMLLQLAVELRGRGRDVVPVGPARGCGWLADQFRQLRFDAETFTLRGPIDPLCALGLVRMFRRRRVGVVHSHEFSMAVYGAAAARFARLPHVITMHGGMGFADRGRRRTALRWAARGSRAFVAVSRPGAEALETSLSLPSGRCLVVENGIAPEAPSAADLRRELGLPGNALVLLAIGNLYAVKGHDVLLKALGGIGPALAGRPWRLLIAGRGEEESALRATAARAGIAPWVSLLGLRADVADLLAAADLFVMPSRSEGLPLALLEAMFAGKAIVASRVGGIPNAVGGDGAVLVPPDDPGALAEGLERVAADEGLRAALGRSAAEAARSRYTVAAMADTYERLYAAGDGVNAA